MYELSQLHDVYQQKCITPTQAASLVAKGDRISYGLGCSGPYDIDLALGARAKELEDV